VKEARQPERELRARQTRQGHTEAPLPPAVLYILVALADGERHGYGIMQEVAGMTDGKVKLGPGTLYGAIKRMISAGLVEESDERPAPELDDERRRYYRLTNVGQRTASAELQRMAAILKSPAARRLIHGLGVA
jgi:DNA-binding PadR family transcriptional regulator